MNLKLALKLLYCVLVTGAVVLTTVPLFGQPGFCEQENWCCLSMAEDELEGCVDACGGSQPCIDVCNSNYTAAKTSCSNSCHDCVAEQGGLCTPVPSWYPGC